MELLLQRLRRVSVFIKMFGYLKRLFVAMRPAFAKKATFSWFVCIFAALVLRTDVLGVTSIVRALALSPECYNSLLNFFRSSAWQASGLMERWWDCLMEQEVQCRANGRLVLLGDHTKTPKDGRSKSERTLLVAHGLFKNAIRIRHAKRPRESAQTKPMRFRQRPDSAGDS